MKDEMKEKMMSVNDMGEAMMFTHISKEKQTIKYQDEFLKKDKQIPLYTSLAEKYGVSAAIILGYIKKATKRYDWAVRTYDDFHNAMPYLSRDTIRRALKKLRDEEVVIAESIGKSGSLAHNTLAYQINYQRLEKVLRDK